MRIGTRSVLFVWYRNVQDYVRRWVDVHKDGR